MLFYLKLSVKNKLFHQNPAECCKIRAATPSFVFTKKKKTDYQCKIQTQNTVKPYNTCKRNTLISTYFANISSSHYKTLGVTSLENISYRS